MMTKASEPEIIRQCADLTMSFSSLFAAAVDDNVLNCFIDRPAYLYVNARAAIRSACDVLRIGGGDEVLVSAYNCGSEVDPVLASGADVSMYRVDHNCAVDLASIEGRISPRTKAVYVTHYFGFPQRAIVDLKSLCERKGLYLIEDCALSLLGTLDDVRLGCRL